MIRPRTAADSDAIAHHYDELDPFYRALWGDHLHHGFWRTGRESPHHAALALVEEVADRAGVQAGSTVCDVGCGYGAPAWYLAGRGARVTALTLSPAQFAHAIRRVTEDPEPTAGAREPDGPGPGPSSRRDGTGAGSSPRFLLCDWLSSGLPAASFDAVIAIESLAHMPSKPAALVQAFRVLKPGGRFVACLWLAGPDPAPWEVRHLLRPICEEGRLPGLPNAAEYRRWAADAGFEDAAIEDVSERVARTWSVSLRRLMGALPRPSSWRYLLDRGNRERRFALSVLRLRVAYGTGAMRYGILTARRPT